LLAKLAEIYVNDAFGAAHRAHASTAGVAAHVKQAAMGLLMEKELKYLHGELAQPARPFVVILGGSKVSDKIGVIKSLMEKADVFLIGADAHAAGGDIDDLPERLADATAAIPTLNFNALLLEIRAPMSPAFSVFGLLLFLIVSFVQRGH